MVDAMGGQKGEYFQEFCRKSLEAYKELRRNAVLIMSLLRLMKDAGIEALAVNPEAKLQTVEDRFRLDLNDEEAEYFFMSLIMESMSHVGIQVCFCVFVFLCFCVYVRVARTHVMCDVVVVASESHVLVPLRMCRCSRASTTLHESCAKRPWCVERAWRKGNAMRALR